MKHLFQLSIITALLFTGCTHNLQEPLVEAVEATVDAIDLDIREGRYSPDPLASVTITRLRDAGKTARRVLDEDREGE